MEEGDQVLSREHHLEPHAVGHEVVKGKVLQTGGLAAANAVLNPGVTTVPSLELGDVFVFLVGDKTWKRKPLTSVNLS